jgi:hypothetical protein
MSIQLNEKLTRFVGFSSNITVSQGKFSLKTTVKNLNLKFVTREILGNEPSHHIFTKTLGEPISFCV